MNKTIDTELCHKECPKHCKQIYSTLNDKTSLDNFIGDSYLKIAIDKAKQFFYIAEIKNSLIQYFADLGGLLGLYLGIPFIEIGILIDQFIRYSKRLLIYFMRTRFFIILRKMKIYLVKIRNFLNILQEINFKFIAKLVFTPILIFQFLMMVNLYFQYPTQTIYEFIPYNISNNLYSVNEFPAITLCYQLLLDKIWFHNYYDHDIVDLEKLRSNSDGLTYFTKSNFYYKYFDNEFWVRFECFKI